MKATKKQCNDSSASGQCCWEGCEDSGEFPAPKPSMLPNERYYFCLEHIREYNKSWDFFQKMNAEQIGRFQKESVVGHRPTWKFGVRAPSYNADEIKREVFGQFRGMYNSRAPRGSDAHLPKNVRAALNVLGLVYPVTMDEIKKKYKELAKTHHPDLNKSGDDAKIKRINEAYSTLKNEDIFK